METKPRQAQTLALQRWCNQRQEGVGRRAAWHQWYNSLPGRTACTHKRRGHHATSHVHDSGSDDTGGIRAHKAGRSGPCGGRYPPERQGGGRCGSPLNALPPKPTQPRIPTLIKRLQESAVEQAEGDDLETDLEKYQGAMQATDVAWFIDHHTQVDEPMVICAMAQDLSRILLVHSIVKYYGGQKREPDFDEKIMKALLYVTQ